METPKKEIPEDDVLAALLKVKPNADMPRSSKPKTTKLDNKPIGDMGGQPTGHKKKGEKL